MDSLLHASHTYSTPKFEYNFGFISNNTAILSDRMLRCFFSHVQRGTPMMANYTSEILHVRVDRSKVSDNDINSV